ncbi:Uncharacterised protein [uncultured archaeon]|nr:Uncharacterised protein [uncultured archaeon]
MADKDTLSRLKISKKTYVFDTRRKYAASRNFLLKKKPENTADELKEKLSGIFSKKGETEKEEKASLAVKQAQSAQAGGGISGTTRTILIIGLVVALFVVLGALYVGYVIGSAPPVAASVPRPDVFGGYYASSIAKSEVISVAENDRTGRSVYALVDYGSQNLSELNFTASVYAQRPTTQVFLLDYPRDSADSYPVFRKRFLDGLPKIGIAASEIDIEHVASVPGGAAIVVPTGYLPEEFIGMGSSFRLQDLLARGVTVIYIGRPFDTVLTKSGDAIPASPVIPLTFNKLTRTRLDSTDGFHLFDAQYTVSPNAEGQGPYFTSAGQIYGSVSVMKLGDGSLILLPESLDGGWGADGGEVAADDVIRLIGEERWLVPLSGTNATADLSSPSGKVSLFTTPFDSDAGYVKFTADAADNNGITRRSTDIFRVQKTARGEMTPRDPLILPAYLSTQRNRLNIQLRETSPTPVKLYIKMYKDETLLQQEDLELGLTNPTTEKTNDFQVNAEPGRYVVRVEDASGKVYAACQLDVVDIDLAVAANDWAKGQFTATLSSPYGPVEPKYIIMSLDGGSERRYSSSSMSIKDGVATLDYQYIGQIQPGNHTVYFEAGENQDGSAVWRRQVLLRYRQAKNIWDNPLTDILALMSLGVFAVGVLLRKPDILRYGLDIPDFPPLSTIKIPVKTETVLEIFDSVNASYSWQWMPLRTDELKNGFRRLTYNGKPILIGDFNLERVLAKLKEKDLVKEELGYWGRASWESESKHSIHYLAIYRILRNVLVNNAMKFSKLDAMADCDVKAVAGKEEIYFHIMEEPYEKVIHRALATSKKGTTILVFKSDEEVEDFRGMLTSTSKLAVGLKMEVNNGNILLLPVKNAISGYLKQIIK